MPGVLCEGGRGARLIDRTNRQRPEGPYSAKPGEVLEVTLAPIQRLALPLLRTSFVKCHKVRGVNDDACGRRLLRTGSDLVALLLRLFLYVYFVTF